MKKIIHLTPDITTVEASFYGKQEHHDNGCITWTGGKHRQGYGMISVTKRGKKTMMTAHRVAMTLKEGRELDVKEYVLHSCGCNSCMNPDHLYLGTRKDITTINYPLHRKSRIKSGSEVS